MSQASRVHSEELLQGGESLLVEHGGVLYELRALADGNLVLAEFGEFDGVWLSKATPAPRRGLC